MGSDTKITQQTNYISVKEVDLDKKLLFGEGVEDLDTIYITIVNSWKTTYSNHLPSLLTPTISVRHGPSTPTRYHV